MCIALFVQLMYSCCIREAFMNTINSKLIFIFIAGEQKKCFLRFFIFTFFFSSQQPCWMTYEMRHNSQVEKRHIHLSPVRFTWWTSQSYYYYTINIQRMVFTKSLSHFFSISPKKWKRTCKTWKKERQCQTGNPNKD